MTSVCRSPRWFRRRRRSVPPVCQPEVENLGAAVARDEHVLRLQVAVNHAARVCGGEPRGDLRAVIDRLPWRQRTVSEHLAQRAAIEQFHHRVSDGTLLAKIVDRDDVRVG